MTLAWRNISERVTPLWFFLTVIVLFPLCVGPDMTLLARIAPGVCWVAALLAMLLTMDGLFKDDWQDGALDQLRLLPHSLPSIILAKIVVNWLVSGLPLLLLSPVVGLLLGMSAKNTALLFLTLLIGTPILNLLAAPSAALTVSLRRGGVMLSLLVLPMAIPVLILAVGAIERYDMGFPVASQLAFMAAILTASLTVSPFITAAAIRIQTV
ncbi:TPA: heme exporter protein CcmB [Enterobacter hormaechei subsp. xiangfangensis]|nr:heme exporter protein CcmB [Enterobacter hormaechei subsp. xiangfangensis]